MNLTFSPLQVTLDLTQDEWDTLQWMESQSPGKFRNLLIMLFQNRALNKHRAEMEDFATRLKNLPANKRDQILTILGN
jgi:hypothetical protein